MSYFFQAIMDGIVFMRRMGGIYPDSISDGVRISEVLSWLIKHEGELKEEGKIGVEYQ